MNSTTRHLRALLEIARLKSFTRAAERLHITQAGLSSMIHELESQLGCRLFDRTTRSVSLTEAGTVLVAAAEEIISRFDRAIAETGEATASARRVLSVAATPFISSSLLPAVCERFRNIVPDVSVRLNDTVHNEVRALIDSGECDLGVGIFFKPTAGIERTPIFDFDFAVVSRADEPMQESSLRAISRSPIAWSALKDEPLLGMPPGHAIQRLVDTHLKPIGRHQDNRPFYNSFHTLLAMVEAGFGSAILPSFVGAAAVGRRLKLQVVEQPRLHLQLCSISKKGRNLPAAAGEFNASLTRVIAERWGTEYS
ncbi:MAG: LysR family transcriptional regulator [Pigmentiphaga sp.]|uniref:LysR family transcriptional regulator n=1 Tax=Pigmentiphaga sp. TaxID=1977564 RepID=UPI0029B42661|nr:LysR family transcriptional regulator [Pigmentiphaga sp.]MDX3905834.1 LysR family transcriptional regulator [Pigmentiphaga sp.]